MDLYFVKRSTLQQAEAVSLVKAATGEELLDVRAIPDGTPVFLDEAMRPVEPVTSWFRHLAHDRKDPMTMRSYAYVLLRLADFLDGRGSRLLAAKEADLVAYRRRRMELQAAPVGEATWDRERAAINGFYGWLVERGLIPRRPVRLGKRFGSGMVREMQVRHLTLEQYLFFRDVGLGGQDPDGELDGEFRGWFPHRGRAAAELALMTGMRKREWSTALLPELGAEGRGRRGAARFWLEACAKYGRRREVYVPDGALHLIERYLALERAEIVEQSLRRLSRRHRDLFVVDLVDDAAGTVSGVLGGRRRRFVIARMPAELRRITVRDTGQGLEAMAVFLGNGGLMLGPSSWDRIRLAAAQRMESYAEHRHAPLLPRRPWRFHDLRHTFALQLLRHLTRRAVHREIRREDPRSLVTIAEHVALNPLLAVQRHLGHAHPRTTYVYLAYLDDPMNYVDEALQAWTDSDGATYAEIARHVAASEGGLDAAPR